MNAVFTIGHSNHPIETFIALLRQHEITAVGDVRSLPFSRFNPQFNRELLQKSLREVGIEYVPLGDALGARARDPGCYVAGRAKYELIAKSPMFLEGIQRVERGRQQHRIALMCAEKEPLDCHRTLLVSRALAGRGIEVIHILADGGLETHDQTMGRLLRLLELPEGDLFRGRTEMIEEAYGRRGGELEYVENGTPEGEAGSEALH